MSSNLPAKGRKDPIRRGWSKQVCKFKVRPVPIWPVPGDKKTTEGKRK